jgi:hypothetical protein
MGEKLQICDGVGGDGKGLEFLFETSSTKQYNIGQRIALTNGGVFRYAYALTAIARNSVAGSGTVAAGHKSNLTLGSSATASAGGKTGEFKVRVQCSGTAVVKDEYAGGQYVVSSHLDGLSSTQVCYIRSHPAAAASATCELTLENPLLWPVDTRCKGNLVLNPFQNVKAFAAATDGFPVGVTTTTVAATKYCWLQTWGPSAVVQNAAGVTIPGAPVVAGSGTGGVVNSVTAVNLLHYPIVGVMGQTAGAVNQLQPVFITIMP